MLFCPCRARASRLLKAHQRLLHPLPKDCVCVHMRVSACVCLLCVCVCVFGACVRSASLRMLTFCLHSLLVSTTPPPLSFSSSLDPLHHLSPSSSLARAFSHTNTHTHSHTHAHAYTHRARWAKGLLPTVLWMTKDCIVSSGTLTVPTILSDFILFRS